MFRRIFHTKFTAFIISAFLCLNLSGAFCVAFCQAKTVSAERHRCPLAKSDSEHCPMPKSADKPELQAKVFKGNLIACCNLAINVFVAKLEKHQVSFQTGIKTARLIEFSKSFTFEKIIYLPDVSYRKPFYDYRIARLKNCVFRI